MHQRWTLLIYWLAFAFVVVGCSPGEETASNVDEPKPAVVVPASEMRKVATFPERIDPSCGNGRARIYDECGDQRAVYAAALESAKADQKVVLVSYGAEWCIWCHVFAQYVAGRFDAFEYELPDETRSMRERRTETTEQEAADLNRFVSDTFVIAHIESDYAPGGWEVLEATGASEYLDNWIPFIFTVGSDGKIAAPLDHERVELSAIPFLSNYRGYSRVRLLAHLREMAESARSGETGVE